MKKYAVSVLITLALVAGGFSFIKSASADVPSNVWLANNADFASSRNGVAYKFDGLTGNVISTTSMPSYYTNGVAIDGNGNVWVANYSSTSSISKLDGLTGVLLGNYPVATSSMGNEIAGVAADANGYIWVSNGNGYSNYVSKLNASTGAVIGTYLSGAGDSGGVAVDSKGDVFVVNGGQFSAGSLYNGTVTKFNGSTGVKIGEYSVGCYPQGIAVDANDNVWVASTYSSCWSVSSAVIAKLDNSTVGGIIGVYPVTDPHGVAADANGYIWVSNTNTHTVSKLDGVTGATLNNYPAGRTPGGVALDVNGNVWIVGRDVSSVGLLSKLNSLSGSAIGSYSFKGYSISFGDLTGYIYKTFVNVTHSAVYTVTYNANGGTGAGPVDLNTYKKDEKVTVMGQGTLSKSGFSFAGWSTSSAGGINYLPTSEFPMGTANVVLYAVWTKQSVCSYFTYTTINNCSLTGEKETKNITAATPAGCIGGTPALTRTCYPGSSYAICSTFTYSAWSACTGTQTRTVLTQSPGGCVGGNPIISQNCVIPGTLTVTFDSQGATVPASPNTKAVVSPVTTVVSLPTPPVRTGYTFNGWYTQVNGGGSVFASSTVVTGNITVYAKWTNLVLPTVTLTVNPAVITASPWTTTINWSSTNATSCVGGGTGTLTNILHPAMSGSVLTGVIASNKDIFMTCTGLGGSATATTTITYAPACTSFTYSAWSTCTNNTQTHTVTSSSPAGCTGGSPVLSQSCTSTAVQYSVAYSLNGATGGIATPPTLSYSQGTIVTTQNFSLNRSGYTFVGWNTLADGSGTNYALGSSFSMPAANITLFAKWIPVSVTCTSFSYSAWSTCTNNTQTHTVASSSPAGCTGGSPVLSQSCSSSSNYATVTYSGNGNDGGSVPVDSHMYGIAVQGVCAANNCLATLLGNSGNLTKKGYTFGGWSLPAVAGIPNSESYFNPGQIVYPGENTTFYAHWIVASVTLTYNSNNDYNATFSGTNLSGSTVTLAGLGSGVSWTKITKTSTAVISYTFSGWNTQADGNGATYAAGSAYTMPAVNTILYAKWTTAPVTPVTCSSFTYSPWSTCVNNTQTHTVTSSSPSGCTGGSPVLTQSCTPTTTVSYVIKTVAGSDASGNPMGVIQKSPDKTTYGAGDVVTVTAVPNATYKFLSWKGGISGTTNPQTITMTSDKTVSANFGQASNTLTIVATNGTVTVSPNKPVYDYGDTVTLTAVPATGYTFSSWSGPFTTGTAITATVYMNGDRTATANFAPVVVAPTASTTATTTSSLSGNQNYATAAVGWDTFLKLLQALR